MQVLKRSSTHKVALTGFAEFEAAWHSPSSPLSWRCLFVLPFWLQTVHAYLGARGQPHILSVTEGRDLLGYVPLAVEGTTARFLGLEDVCDYQDIIVRRGAETAVMAAVITWLRGRGVTCIALRSLRPDALALRGARTLAADQALDVKIASREAAYQASLPLHWEDYLMRLDGKQRHEVRRKMRRLQSRGPFTYRLSTADDDLQKDIKTFLRLFRLNRADKADFMNPVMTACFRELIHRLAQAKMLSLYLLEVEGTPAAGVLCVDYQGVRYLYNSGYDARFQSLSVGVLAKVLSIQKGIEAGCRRYDFLKGAEAYKRRLGGREVKLYGCTINL